LSKASQIVGPGSPSFKGQYGWSIAFYLPFIPTATRAAIALNLSPNSISMLSFLFTSIALPLFVFTDRSIPIRILITLLLALGTFLDVLDGYVARANGNAGRFGAMLDAGLDLVRYNLFFFAVYIAAKLTPFQSASLLIYSLLVSASLFRTFRRALSVKPKDMLASHAIESFLPSKYRAFCLSHRFLYNPLNIEDQLNLYIFGIAILFDIPGPMILLCLAARLSEIIFTLVCQLTSTL
jgi:phosphatidylglycerophosphate synthase